MRIHLSFAAIAVLLVARNAGASPTFPGTIQTDLQLNYTPDCSLCHANGQTGNGTATSLFAMNMKARGLVPLDTASVQTALTKMAADKVDSDGDGVTDIDELKAGTNPNGAGTGSSPIYGCGAASISAATPHGAVAFGWLALAAAAVARLRRRRGR